MGLPTSGLSNEDLTIRVEEFVDRMLQLNEKPEDALWQFFPTLVAASSGIIVFELWRRYQKKAISFEEFKTLTLKTLGLKAAKYGAIFAALPVPGLNVLVSAYLLGSMIFSVNRFVNDSVSFKPLSFLR